MHTLETISYYDTTYEPQHGEAELGEARFIWRIVAVGRTEYARFVENVGLDTAQRENLMRGLLRAQHIEYERAPHEDGRAWNSRVAHERTERYAIFRQRAFSWN